jgi:hypothetical protein
MLTEMNSQNGAIWAFGNNQLTPLITIGLDDSNLFNSDHSKQALQQLLTNTLTKGSVQSCDSEGVIDADSLGHVTLFAAPFLIPNQNPGVIMIALDPNLPMQRREAIGRHLELRCREFSRHSAMRATPNGSPPEGLPHLNQQIPPSRLRQPRPQLRVNPARPPIPRRLSTIYCRCSGAWI